MILFEQKDESGMVREGPYFCIEIDTLDTFCAERIVIWFFEEEGVDTTRIFPIHCSLRINLI